MNRLSLISTLSRVLFLLIGLILYTSGISQSNASVLDFHLKQGSSSTFTIKSTSTPTPKIDLEISDWGFLSQPTQSENGEYELTYTAPSDFEGEFSFFIEYTGVSLFPSVRSYTKYTELRIKVSETLIQTTDDIVILNEGESIDIQPTLNDQYSDGPLTLIHLANVNQGSAEIIDASTIRYNKPDEFTGRDIINYVVEDLTGNKGNGIIYIVSESQVNKSDTIYLIVSSENSQYIFLPKSGMNLTSHQGGNGDLQSVSDIAYQISPIPGRIGEDRITFEDGNGYTRTVIVSILDNSPDTDVVKDDKIYTAVGREISFDVSTNDLISGEAIVYHSPELTDLGNGKFSYQPDADFIGFKEFIYRVNTGSEFLTGKILLKIDNYYPIPISYHFKAIEGQPLILNYEVPIQGFQYNVLSAPSNGDLEYFANNSNVELDCGLVNIASVIYSPNGGFIGNDEFDLEYCIDGEQCVVVKISVEVIPNAAANCACVDNCVWPGDTDRNGIVDLTDVLAIGYYMGETGAERNEASNEWKAQNSENWFSTQVSGINLKHVDGNGDGMITHEDTSAVITNFGKYSSLIPSSVQLLKKSPIILIPRTTEVDSGDVMVIDIALGNALNPVLDIHGLTFQMNISPSIMDSASFDIYFHDESWISDGFGVMQKFIQPQEGVIKSVLTKTNGLPKSGEGIIGTTTFIVEDEINGFRIKDGVDKLPFDIDITDILAYDSYGQQYTLPEASTTFFLKLKESPEVIDPTIDTPLPLIEDKLMVFPNPVKDILNIHLNGSRELSEVRLYDMLGKILYSNNILRTNRLELNVSNYQAGLYMLEVSDGTQVSVQKVKISR